MKFPRHTTKMIDTTDDVLVSGAELQRLRSQLHLVVVVNNVLSSSSVHFDGTDPFVAHPLVILSSLVNVSMVNKVNHP